MKHGKSHKKIGKASPGSMVTRKVSQGPNKGDTVKFTANSSSARLPGKLVARKLVKDTGTKNRSKLPRARHKKR